MAFIDNLAFSLFTISFAGFLLLYTGSWMYLIMYKRKGKSFSDHLKSASVPLAIIGITMFSGGLWGHFAWPLPGSYNILFYDPLLFFGILLIAFSICVNFKLKLEYTGVLGLLSGIVTIFYGAVGYGLHMTSAPLAMLLMYAFYGLGGILSYPVSLLADRMQGSPQRPAATWQVLLIVFLIFLLFASLLSGLVGVMAIPKHLLSAP